MQQLFALDACAADGDELQAFRRPLRTGLQPQTPGLEQFRNQNQAVRAGFGKTFLQPFRCEACHALPTDSGQSGQVNFSTAQ